MDRNIREFYRLSAPTKGDAEQSEGGFHRVIALMEAPDIEWENIYQLVPHLVRGWFELSSFSSKDRVEFVRDYWISKLPFHLNLSKFIFAFFDSVDDIGIYLTQKYDNEPFNAEMVYILKGHSCFYRGDLPAKESDLYELKTHFAPKVFPPDYLAFLQIHNGFCKTTDRRGILSVKGSIELYAKFQKNFEDPARIPQSLGEKINPSSLIPFYESFGMPYYQSFWSEWYPEGEMGNVYYSAETGTISSVSSGEFNPENMSFNTFSDWLIFYLEQIT